MSSDSSFAAEIGSFNPVTKKLEALNGVLYHHDDPPKAAAQITARFSGPHTLINLTGRTVKGSGTIKSGATFYLKIDDTGTPKFEYSDETQGLKLSSSKKGCILIVESEEEVLAIEGSGLVSKDNSPRGELHDFRVVVRDLGNEKKQKDLF